MIRKALIAAAFFCAAPLSAYAAEAPPPEVKAVLDRECYECHEEAKVFSKSHTADEWSALLGRMVMLGAVIDANEQKALLAYLTTNFGAKTAAAPASGGK